MKKIVSGVLFFFLISSYLYGQEAKVKLKVIDAENNPLRVARVNYKQQQRFTDMNGKCLIEVEKNASFDKNILKIEKRGYAIKTISYHANQSEVDVVMQKENQINIADNQINTNQEIRKTVQIKENSPTNSATSIKSSNARQLVNALNAEREVAVNQANQTRAQVSELTIPLKNRTLKDENEEKALKTDLKLIRETLLNNEQIYEGIQERNRALMNELAFLVALKDSISDFNIVAIKKLDSLFVAQEKAEQEKQLTKLENQRTQIIIAAIAFFLLVLAMILFLFGRREQKRKNQLTLKNQEIEQQSTKLKVLNEALFQTNEELKSTLDVVSEQAKELKSKNTDITASIQAAKLIQDSILPSEKLIGSTLDNFFILYRPRDIVSGDFYYYNEKSGKIILAAVDSTGHGVPGAFMSMLGNQILNEIIEQKNITQADKILNELNAVIYHSLRQKESETHAGMDLALCVIDKKNKLVEYAGAMNPLYYVQKGEFKEIKADKQAIGGVENKSDKSFNLHYLSLSSPTTFYICSDGFQDQFGGENGKKFMVKKLKELLFSIHQLPLKEQKSVIEHTLDAWQGGQEQVDDILIIGFLLG